MLDGPVRLPGKWVAVRLLRELEARLSREESYFRAHLIREDIDRLQRLVVLAEEAASEADFLHAGTYIGWTRDDMMTHRIKEPLDDVLHAIYALVVHGETDEREAALAAAWQSFDRERMEKLIKCL